MATYFLAPHGRQLTLAGATTTVPWYCAQSNRMEFRLTDGSSDVYLALARTIGAMLDGVEQILMPPALIDEDIYVWDEAELVKRGVKALPQTLGEALAALSADTL